jgi:hypothetical protein
LFQATYISHHNSVIIGDEKMKTWKIALAFTAIIGLATFAIGLTLAHYTNTPFDYAHSYVSDAESEDWWTEMREYMEARWNGIEDEEWFDDMTQYMEEHWEEVQNQDWFNQMLEYMEEQGYHPYGYSNYEDNYYGPRYYGRRGFACWGW